MLSPASFIFLQVEINLKRYPTPYPEDLKNMVKSVQSLVGKNVHTGLGLQHQHQHQLSAGTVTSVGPNMDHTHLSKEQYEPPWPLPPKEAGIPSFLFLLHDSLRFDYIMKQMHK